MRLRPLYTFRPGVERLEAKQTLSAGLSTSAVAASALAQLAARAHQPLVLTGITMDRITNPTRQNAALIPPFQHVLVQSVPPVPGQVYNLLFLSVYNGTGRTFNASDGLTVKISNQTSAHAYTILTGDQQWKPGQRIVFYLLTKKYYPLTPSKSAGFQFNFVSPRIQAIPGPSGIFLRLRYNPATFDKVLDTIVVSGPGARGHQTGLADTAIWEIIPATTKAIIL
jgi:hypothetical protein